jgi:D-alanyl-D-alanine carboxypeptidase/D-alanyl-D-alanine-endopeptidase (penicillin-binding protein 4)
MPHPPLLSGAGQLRLALTKLMRQAGPATGALVYDLKADRAVFAQRDGIKRAPASVEKLYTSVALLRKMGPDARLRTTVVGDGHLGPGGVWHGDLYLRGGGDPTLGDARFNAIWEQGLGPTAGELAQQLADGGIKRVTGKVIGDPSMFDGRPGGPSSGFGPDLPDIGGQLSGLTYNHGATPKGLSPGAFAAQQLAGALRAMHIDANAATSFTARRPPGSRRLASVSSPPMSTLLKLTNVPSDDLFAEMLTKQLGARFGGLGSTGAGARVISDEIASFGLHPTIVDGSGLSRDNQSSPREAVAILRFIWGSAIGDVVSASLPSVGVNGTTRRIAKGTIAQGRCVAKTGTLDNVTNLAGYCHVVGRRAVAFALFVDGPSNEQALMLIGNMVAAIVRY